MCAALFLIHTDATLISARSSPQQSRAMIAQPSRWVAFSADLMRVHELSGKVYAGRAYTAADGSTRYETGPTLKSIDAIAIKNIATKTFFVWQGGSTWTSQPMQLPPHGWIPVPRALGDKTTVVSDLIEGYSVVKTSWAKGWIYEAPQLNFFPVTTMWTCQTAIAKSCGIWYYNITPGEQPSDLFAPPRDATIIPLDEPGGIVKR